MGTTLTIRADDRLRDALDERARTLGTTRSQLVRDILEDALVERPLGDRISRLRGTVRVPRTRNGWRREIRSRNWRS
jgi:metal-responsive CopG/Arc/MetJ family transcriptional regulator